MSTLIRCQRATVWPTPRAMSSRFDGGVGVFEGDDELRGEPIRVRFVWDDNTDRSARWSQAFRRPHETDREVNWTMHFSR